MSVYSLKRILKTFLAGKRRDEPLNFIDVYSRMQIEQLITEFAPTMLLVEHDSVFRDTVASKIVNI